MQPGQAKVNLEEKALIQLSRRGDQAAMEQLILRYQHRIYNAVLKMCANHDDAAELTQETFVKIIQSLDTFEGKSSFYTWAFRIAINLTLNYRQRSRRVEYQSLDADEYKSHEEASRVLKDCLSDDKSIDPATLAQNKELGEIAVKSLMKLDDAQRAVVILRDIEGMNYAQIAEVLNIELGTVRSRLSRARNRLRGILEAVLK